MRAKKATTPSRSIRYLLYADRTLQRLSLRKLSVRRKKANKPPRSSGAKKNAARETTRSAKAATVAPVTMASPSLPRIDRWVVGGVACAVGIAALIGVGIPYQQVDRSSATMAADLTGARKDAAPLPSVKPAAKVSTANARTRATATSTGSGLTTEPKSPAVDATPDAEHPAPTSNAVGQNAGLVTIEGCLQARDDAFWLKDTSGEDAPQSRSWKSGFLKKHSSSVEVVDANDALKLAKFVGQRVAATGVVADRRMRAHLLQRVAATCG